MLENYFSRALLGKEKIPLEDAIECKVIKWEDLKVFTERKK